MAHVAVETVAQIAGKMLTHVAAADAQVAVVVPQIDVVEGVVEMPTPFSW